jgi:hypothetical protein
MAATTGNVAVVAREVLETSTGQANVAGVAREVLIDGRTFALVSGLAREVLISGGGLVGGGPSQYAVTVIGG